MEGGGNSHLLVIQLVAYSLSHSLESRHTSPHFDQLFVLSLQHDLLLVSVLVYEVLV